MRRNALAALVLVFSMGLVACAGGNNSSPTSPSPTPTAAADPISTLGAGDTYQTCCGTPFGGVAIGSTSEMDDLAVAFTPYNNDDSEFARGRRASRRRVRPDIGRYDGPCTLVPSLNAVTLTVLNDSSGVPGTAIETINLTGVLQSTPTIILVNSIARPKLTGGTRYWLMLSLPGAGSTDYGDWMAATSASGTGAFRKNGGAWTAGPTTPTRAYRITFAAS